MIFRINLLSPILVILLLTILPSFRVSAQRQKKTDKLILTNLDEHIRYLSGEKAAGRKTGTPGEKLAGDYIASEFSKAGLKPRGDNGGWLQGFEIDQGRVISGDACFIVNDHPLMLNKEYFPLGFSAIGSVTGSPAIALQESGVPWFLDLRDLLENQEGAKSDLAGAIRARASAYAKKGATALIVYNTSKTPDNLAFDSKDKSEPVAIPVVYLTPVAKKKYLRDESASVDIRIRTGFSEKICTGHNVVGYLDNGASTTVVIGARYDHSGNPGDSLRNASIADNAGIGNSAGGASAENEDNATGVAAMIELARMLATSKLKSNNYLFVAFSGAEQGSYGSRFLAEHPPLDPKNMNYMLDLDRNAPPQDSSYGLIVGGDGSSPAWWGTCREVVNKMTFSFQLDSSYARPGDHSSFYSKSVPALVFYMGADHPNHALELEVVKYVFDIVKAANTRGKFTFTPITKS
jgi:hypothetical protein